MGDSVTNGITPSRFLDMSGYLWVHLDSNCLCVVMCHKADIESFCTVAQITASQAGYHQDMWCPFSRHKARLCLSKSALN